jgi:hypothetical protein
MPMVNAIIIGHQDSYKALGFGMLAHGFGWLILNRLTEKSFVWSCKVRVLV